jgi:cysteine desulfurase
MAKAFEMCRQGETLNRKEGHSLASKKIKTIRDYFWQKIQKEIPEAILNGDLENRLPNNLNISIPGIDSEFIVLCLDEAGIVCSTKSACGNALDGSFVVRALGGGETRTKSTLRFSLGEDIFKKDIDYVVATLKSLVCRLNSSENK